MTRTLNLDSGFLPVPYPEIEFEMLKFSGGELHIKLNTRIDYEDVQRVIITHRINSTDDLMKVLIAKDALQRLGVKHFELVMPYIPYARQDRQCAQFESFTFKVFTDLLNSAKFDRILVLDSHSDVAPALLDESHCENISNARFVQDAL